MAEEKKVILKTEAFISVNSNSSHFLLLFENSRVLVLPDCPASFYTAFSAYKMQFQINCKKILFISLYSLLLSTSIDFDQSAYYEPKVLSFVSSHI